MPELQMLHGQLRAPMVTARVVSAPTLPLSSAARTRSVAVPVLPGTQVYVQAPRPAAGCQVAPLSVDTSTPPTTPPPVSVAVPETVVAEPDCTVAPAAGAVIAAAGPTVSVEA